MTELLSAHYKDSASTYLQLGGESGIRKLVNRAREKRSLPAVNVKRVYRVMRDHNLLLERRIKQPGVPRRHEGRIAVETSDTRWCSDGFEFRCEDGAKLSVTFALDCCDREAIGWVASPTGYSGDDIRDLMLDALVINCPLRRCNG